MLLEWQNGLPPGPPTHVLTERLRAWLPCRPYMSPVVHHSEYKQHLPELLAHAAPHYVLFTSGTVEINGTHYPWCPDCSHTLPIIK